MPTEYGFGIAFDRTNAEAAAWAKTRSAALVVQISEQVRNGIRNIMGRAFDEHIPPREAARLLKSIVGLTDGQMEAVWNLRRRLMASPGRKVWAGDVGIDVPNEPTLDFVERQAERYSERLLRWRTETIARSETMVASNEGQRQLWKQAAAVGSLEGTEKRKWLAARSERTCDTCRAMHGQETGIDEPYTLPDGTRVMNAHAHPDCRCSEGLVVPEFRASASQYGKAGTPGYWKAYYRSRRGGGGRVPSRLKQLYLDYTGAGTESGEIRAKRALVPFVKKTAPGGSLAHLRPKAGTVLYRGVASDATHQGGKRVFSWSRSKAGAKMFAQGGKVYKTTVRDDEPALDFKKVQKGALAEEVLLLRSLKAERTLRSAASVYGKPGTPEYARNYYRAHHRGEVQSRVEDAAPLSEAEAREFVIKHDVGDSEPALREYQGAEYGVTNGYARAAAIPGKLESMGYGAADKQVVEIKARIAAMDAAFTSDRAASFDKPTIVYRGMKGVEVKVGDTVQDHGFTSTSLNLREASRFTRREASGVVMNITVQPGRKFLVMSKGEQEILLPRGGRYRIIGEEVVEGVRHVSAVWE